MSNSSPQMLVSDDENEDSMQENTGVALSKDIDENTLVLNERDAIRFDALRNAIYHTARRLHFEKLSRLTNFVVIIFGTATFSSLANNNEYLSFVIGLSLAVVGAAQIVYDFGGQAKTHNILQRDYYRIMASIERVNKPTVEDVYQWKGELASLAGDEPPTMRALDAVAYNAAADALYHRHSYALEIGFFPNVFKQYIAFNNKSFEYKRNPEV